MTLKVQTNLKFLSYLILLQFTSGFNSLIFLLFFLLPNFDKEMKSTTQHDLKF